MAGCDEDLEFNPFYQALQSRFYSLYEQAQQNCWLVCIPVAASLEASQITKTLIEYHLLEPSGFLRDVYHSSGPSKLEWKLCQNQLVCSSWKICELSVRVLSEELAYNKSLRQFKIFITERPLDPNHKMPSPVQEVPGGSPIPGRDILKRRRTYQEHRGLLESFMRYREGLEELNKQIRLFQQNYLVVTVESLLLDTATKLKGMAKQGYTGFIEANKQDSKFADKRMYEACWLSIEGYLMHHVHSKVFPAVREVHARQDQDLKERCRRLRGRLTPSLLGVPEDYDCPYPSTTNHLNSMCRVDTPLEMLYAVQDAMDSVMIDAQKNFDLSLRIGAPQPLASDGLIALMAAILVKVNLDCLLSMLYYMENFHWSPTDSDQLSYILVTIRAAVEFLRSPDVNQWLPQVPNSNKPARVSPVASLPKSSDESDCQLSSLSMSLSTSASVASEESTSTSSSGRSRGGGGREDDNIAVNGSASLLPGSTLLQALSARLGVSEKEVVDTHEKMQQRRRTDDDLGPFLSRLMETDRVVTSSDYDIM